MLLGCWAPAREPGVPGAWSGLGRLLTEGVCRTCIQLRSFLYSFVVVVCVVLRLLYVQVRNSDLGCKLYRLRSLRC